MPPVADSSRDTVAGLSSGEITKIINRYIGVSGGYLGDFSYRTHADFYPEFCDLDINPDLIEDSTTRYRFQQILQRTSPWEQAKIVRGVVERFPIGGFKAPATRTAELRDELLRIATRLEGTAVVGPTPRITSDLVQRALADADTLIRAQGATSAVDRVHTALHGYLMAVCSDAGLTHAPDANITTLLRLIRDRHPRLAAGSAPRSQEITTILRSLAGIIDALSPVRNMASVAHPNPTLLGDAEAVLVVDTGRTLLQYLDAKLKA
jgi:hypothetical protein